MWVGVTGGVFSLVRLQETCCASESRAVINVGGAVPVAMALAANGGRRWDSASHIQGLFQAVYQSSLKAGLETLTRYLMFYWGQD